MKQCSLSSDAALLLYLFPSTPQLGLSQDPLLSEAFYSEVV